MRVRNICDAQVSPWEFTSWELTHGLGFVSEIYLKYHPFSIVSNLGHKAGIF